MAGVIGAKVRGPGYPYSVSVYGSVSEARRAELQDALAEIVALRKERDIELDRATHYRDLWQTAAQELASLRELLVEALDAGAENR